MLGIVLSATCKNRAEHYILETLMSNTCKKLC